MKNIDLNKSVFELTKEYPELIEILNDLGFTEISKKAVLNSVGKIMTIPKGAVMKNISMIDVVMKLKENGFELSGEMPVISVEKVQEINEIESDNKDSRKEQLKAYLKRLGNGEDLESVREDFVKNFSDVDASEIMNAEQELLKEGTPLEEVQRLCDVHSALFHGATTEEKIANAEKAVEDSLMKKKIQEALEKRDSYPQKDYSNKHALASELSSIKGHPLYTFTKENEVLDDLLKSYREQKSDELFSKLKEVIIHYKKKGDLLYPHLNVKYGVSGPSDVMWTVDDEIRDEFTKLSKISEHDAQWDERMNALLTRVEEMIYKEKNILFPICAVNFTESEWYGVYHDSKDYEDCFGVINEIWHDAKDYTPEVQTAFDGEIVMPGGHMNIEQLTAMLNTIPLEITFVDADNINRYFNEGPKVFKRPTMAIDRDVFSCHPPKIEPMVRAIIEDFRNGVRDSVPVWMEKSGRTMLVNYIAVRDKNNKYLGTVEVIQDMEFAKAHFQK